jgi:threonine dehydrogenase-like Zn-dependent dehydrogenase
MLTVICETPGTLSAQERTKPEAGENDVLLRVKRVGVCGTDLHIFTGNQPYLAYPRVMGHELSGIVEQAPAHSGLVAGDQVYVMPYLSCGECIACLRGKTNCCVNIQVLGVHRDGAFTEYLSIPAQFVHKAEGISLDQAAMVEFLAIGAHAVRRGEVKPGERVLVVGAGCNRYRPRHPCRPARLLREGTWRHGSRADRRGRYGATVCAHGRRLL